MSRPRNKLRDAYAQRYSLSPKRTKLLVPRFIEQLERCKDDDARNVLLGVGEREMMVHVSWESGLNMKTQLPISDAKDLFAELQEKRARQLGRLA